MSRYGIDYYGLGYYGPDNLSTYSAAPATSISTQYGSIQLDWVNPSGNWSKLRLVRNSYGFPTSPYDGISLVDVYQGSDPTTFIDSVDIKEGAFYYYSVFVYQVVSYTWVRSANIIGTSVKNFGNGNKMFEYLPEVYKTASLYSVDGNENQQLKSFLNLFGFQLDYAQTITELLIDRYDVQKVNGNLIPLLLNQFGLDYEPEIGLQQSRILVRDAIQLYKEKGTLQGLKEYIKAFSGYALTAAVSGVENPATEGIIIGHNLMLDYNDSSFEESKGHWDTLSNSSLYRLGIKSINKVELTSNVAKITIGAHTYAVGTKVTITNCSVPLFNQLTAVTITAISSNTISFALVATDVLPQKAIGTVLPNPLPWAESTAPVNFPNKQTGILAVTNSTSGSATVSVSCGTSNPVTKGIPIIAGEDYTFSVYSAAKSATRSITAKIHWYTRLGVSISTSSGSGITNATGTFTTRPYVTGTAPTDAAYAVPEISIASVAAAAGLEFHYFDAAQFEKSASVTDFEDARTVHITLKANRINELINPDFVSPFTPWLVTGATSTVDPLSIEPTVDSFIVTQSSLTSNLATLVTKTIHHLEIGEQVAVNDVGSPYNGSWTITSKTPDSFSYALTNADLPLVTGLNGISAHASNALKLEATSTTVTVNSSTTSADYMKIHYPGAVYTFSAYAKTTAGTENITTSINWYNASNVLISSSTGELTEVDTNWTRSSVTGLAPSNTASASVVITWETSIGNIIEVDQGLFEQSPFVLPYFCGDADSNTVQKSDVFWEGGVVNGSRSHFYKNRVSNYNRLKDSLSEFLPAGTSFALYLAQPQT